MTSLVNETLKFQTLISHLCQYFCWKNVRSFYSVIGYKVAKHLTSWPLNELVKLTMLWTTRPSRILVIMAKELSANLTFDWDSCAPAPLGIIPLAISFAISVPGGRWCLGGVAVSVCTLVFPPSQENSKEHQSTVLQDSILLGTSFCSYARPAQPCPIRWLGPLKSA